MKNKVLLLTSLIAFSATSFAETQYGKREVILDNEKVEVVRLTYPVGSESGMHTHIYPNRTVYFVKGGKLALIPEDNKAKPKILEVPDGKIIYLPAMTHNVKNIGNTEIVIIENEIKQ
jgi:mannose-6-phosphate isomerase-like protein (cupin superfamily)